jgi:hypothetical protein
MLRKLFSWAAVSLVVVAVAMLVLLLASCSSPTAPADDVTQALAWGPQFEQVYQGGGGGAGGGGTYLTDSKGHACTLHGTSNSVECSQLLIKILTGGAAAGAACLRGAISACVGFGGYGTNALVDWKNHPDPWYEPWNNPGTPGSQGLWPPGVGGTYPMPIGGY